jgi:hypothetical protein
VTKNYTHSNAISVLLIAVGSIPTDNVKELRSFKSEMQKKSRRMNSRGSVFENVCTKLFILFYILNHPLAGQNQLAILR